MLINYRPRMAPEGDAGGSPSGSTGAASGAPAPSSPPAAANAGSTGSDLAAENARLKKQLDDANRRSASFEERFGALEGRLDNSDKLAADLKALQENNAALKSRVESYEGQDKQARDELFKKLPEDRQKVLKPAIENMSPRAALDLLRAESTASAGDDDDGEGVPPAPIAGNNPEGPPVPKRYKPRFGAHIEDATGREVSMLPKMVHSKAADGTQSFTLNKKDWRNALKQKGKGAGVELTKENAAQRNALKRY